MIIPPIKICGGCIHLIVQGKTTMYYFCEIKQLPRDSWSETCEEYEEREGEE